MARVERRQRQLRREEAEEAEAREEEMEKTRVTEGVVSSSRRIEEALSSVSAAQSLTEVSSLVLSYTQTLIHIYIRSDCNNLPLIH